MDIVVTSENAPQIIQAMYENVKSNQHRIDIMEPTFNKMAKQVDRLDQMMVRNGFAKAVETNAAELKEFRGEFLDFKLHREDSCPVSKRSKERDQKDSQAKNWRAVVVRLIFGSIGTISTVIVIAEKIII